MVAVTLAAAADTVVETREAMVEEVSDSVDADLCTSTC